MTMEAAQSSSKHQALIVRSNQGIDALSNGRFDEAARTFRLVLEELIAYIREDASVARVGLSRIQISSRQLCSVPESARNSSDHNTLFLSTSAFEFCCSDERQLHDELCTSFSNNQEEAISCALLFNLALTYHLRAEMYRTSDADIVRAYKLYRKATEVALSLPHIGLLGDQCHVVLACATNNMAHASNHFFDVGTTGSHIGSLRRMLFSSGSWQQDQKLYQDLLTNVVSAENHEQRPASAA